MPQSPFVRRGSSVGLTSFPDSWGLFRDGCAHNSLSAATQWFTLYGQTEQQPPEQQISHTAGNDTGEGCSQGTGRMSEQ